MAPKEGKEASNPENENLISAGCAAYGIKPQFVLASSIDKATGEAVIVTVGGTKVRYGTGAKVESLSAIAVTGINPAAKRKPIAGKDKEA